MGSKGWHTRKRETMDSLAQNVVLELLTRLSPCHLVPSRLSFPSWPWSRTATHTLWGNSGLLFSGYVIKKLTQFLPASYLIQVCILGPFPTPQLPWNPEFSPSPPGDIGPLALNLVRTGRRRWRTVDCTQKSESMGPGFAGPWKAVWLRTNSTMRPLSESQFACLEDGSNNAHRSRLLRPMSETVHVS